MKSSPPSYSSLLPKDTATLSKCSACKVFQVAVLFLFRLNIIIELAFIDVSMDGEKLSYSFIVCQ